METWRLIIDEIRESDKEDYFYNISHDKKVLETFICKYVGDIKDFDETQESCEIGYGIGSNTWDYTKLGHINLTKNELTDLLADEDVTITLSLK